MLVTARGLPATAPSSKRSTRSAPVGTWPTPARFSPRRCTAHRTNRTRPRRAARVPVRCTIRGRRGENHPRPGRSTSSSQAFEENLLPQRGTTTSVPAPIFTSPLREQIADCASKSRFVALCETIDLPIPAHGMFARSRARGRRSPARRLRRPARLLARRARLPDRRGRARARAAARTADPPPTTPSLFVQPVRRRTRIPAPSASFTTARVCSSCP